MKSIFRVTGLVPGANRISVVPGVDNIRHLLEREQYLECDTPDDIDASIDLVKKQFESEGWRRVFVSHIGTTT